MPDEQTAADQDQRPSRPIDAYFKAAVKNKASDLHLKVGQPPKLRIKGNLRNLSGDPLSSEQVKSLIYDILSQSQRMHFESTGTLDFAHELDDESRFRINIFNQRGFISMAARRVESQIPNFEDIHLPDTLSHIADRAQGLVLVVGPTGSGKTTTIATMINHVNHTRNCHIITVEDPIEYIFKDDKAIVSQREIGIDVESYEDALTYLMRQDPDVVFVGEMRDAQTVTAGMRAAETGHLVFGTMHSTNAAQAVGRLLDLFPQNERDQVRAMLSLTVKAIISQFLLPSIKEGLDRIPAVEIMLASPQIRKVIAEKREGDIPSIIRASEREGMVDITNNLCKLVMDGMVSPKEAYRLAPNPEELKMALKGIRSSTSNIL